MSRRDSSGWSLVLFGEELSMIDIVISTCHSDQREIWKNTAERLIKFVASHRYVVYVPDAEVGSFKRCTPSQIDVVPESQLLDEFIAVLDHKIMAACNTSRRGWYLQQFVKLAALFENQNLNQLLIWDSDTLPLRRLQFFDDLSGSPVYYFGDECHLPYLECNKAILGLDRQIRRSFIAQCFPILGEDISALRRFLELDDDPWWKLVLDNIDFSLESGFSEYEFLGTFVGSRSPSINFQVGKWTRNGYLLWKTPSTIPERLRYRGRHLDYAAFESWQSRNWRTRPKQIHALYHSIRRT